ncbi:MAG TPA: mechanosensitive ion channel [Anaerolineales bacterium]|nr:mechanosensitive ion channel [Anaerolineales bacterium]
MSNLTTALQTLLVDFLKFLPGLFVAIVILVIAAYVAGVVSRMIRKALLARGANSQVEHLLSQTARWAILVLGLVTALQQVDFDITGLVAGLGIVGFALGFALQDIAANFISGIILLIQQPFHPGDLIQTNGHLGIVKAVDLRATLLQTQAGEDILIPNGKVLSDAMTNFSKSPGKRVMVDVGVAYDSDLEVVRQTVIEALKEVPARLEDKTPFVRFHTFASSSISLTGYVWVDITKIHPLDAKDAAMTKVKAAFDRAGIEIPLPIQVVYSNEKKDIQDT